MQSIILASLGEVLAKHFENKDVNGLWSVIMFVCLPEVKCLKVSKENTTPSNSLSMLA